MVARYRNIDLRRRIHLLRHGEVAYFDEQGRPINPRDVSLTADGRRQAAAVHDLLRPVDFDWIVHSGLPRTRETAEIVAGDRMVSLTANAEFAEIRGGRLSNLATTEVRSAFTYAYERAGEQDAHFLGGDGFEAFYQRVVTAWHKVLSSVGWRQGLLVAHDAVIRVVLADTLGSTRDTLRHIEQDPCGLSIVDRIERHDGRVQTVVRASNLTPWDPAKLTCWDLSMEAAGRRYHRFERS